MGAGHIVIYPSMVVNASEYIMKSEYMKEQIFESWGCKDMTEYGHVFKSCSSPGQEKTQVRLTGARKILLSGKWKWKFGGPLGKWN